MRGNGAQEATIRAALQQDCAETLPLGKQPPMCAGEAGSRRGPAPGLALVSCFLSVPGGDEISQSAKAAVPAAADTAAGIFGLDGLVT